MSTNELTPGLKAEIVTTVDDKLVVKHMGGDGVLSTPNMIGLMERAGMVTPPLSTAIVAPLKHGGTILGALAAYSPSTETFSDDHQYAMERIAAAFAARERTSSHVSLDRTVAVRSTAN